MSVRYRLPGDLDSRDAETDLLWQLGSQGIVQEGETIVAYFAQPLEIPLPGRWEEVEETDWLSAYYRDLQPVRIGRLIVAPTHCTVEADTDNRVLWLDPGMAFGTGHHATTRLALAVLEGRELEGKRVLDVGSGSGILAIAADLLGADYTMGLDIDPDTLPIAEENRVLNHAQVDFRVGVLDASIPDASFDILVANLFAELHAELAPAYERVLVPGGDLYATGIWDERFAIAHNALESLFNIVRVEREGEWSLIHARKRYE